MRKYCDIFADSRVPRPIAAAFPSSNPDPRLISIGEIFIQLQEYRHKTDYNTYCSFTRREALYCQNLAATAIAHWKSIRTTEEGDAFLAGLLMANNLNQ